MWERFLGVHKPAIYRFANVENLIFGVHKPAVSRVGEVERERFWVPIAPPFLESTNVGIFFVYKSIYVCMVL